MPKPPKPPKPEMLWGVYNKGGKLIAARRLRRQAANLATVERGEYVRRVMVTPIATKGER